MSGHLATTETADRLIKNKTKQKHRACTSDHSIFGPTKYKPRFMRRLVIHIVNMEIHLLVHFKYLQNRFTDKSVVPQRAVNGYIYYSARA